MMATAGGAGRAKLWAWTGGIVLVAGVIAIIIATLSNQAPTPAPPPDPSSSPTGSTPTSSSDPGEVVDPSATGRGWTPEPITTDPEEYAAAALEAAATFDTTLSSRDDWLAYLETWFTPDTRYSSLSDREAELKAALLELRQGVVLPEAEWDSLAAEDGRVVSESGEVSLSAVPEDASGDMAIATADVVLLFTRTDGSGVESSYEESVRVSVQVLCAEGSVPTPDTAQQAGDCKVVRFFTEPVEP